jgi:hypothetical protein
MNLKSCSPSRNRQRQPMGQKKFRDINDEQQNQGLTPIAASLAMPGTSTHPTTGTHITQTNTILAFVGQRNDVMCSFWIMRKQSVQHRFDPAIGEASNYMKYLHDV